MIVAPAPADSRAAMRWSRFTWKYEMSLSQSTTVQKSVKVPYIGSGCWYQTVTMGKPMSHSALARCQPSTWPSEVDTALRTATASIA